MVYVLDFYGQPLMPTSRHGKVRHLLKSGKAKVVKKCPFTIKLLYKTTNYTQNLILGVDTGSSHVGFAVCNPTKSEIVYSSDVQLRNDIKNRMDDRRGYRKSRRSRKTRYRKARFLNRKNSIRKDRFNPTMVSKISSHIREIEFIKSILPITKLVLELGTFDCHLMKNKDIPFNRHWGYQKGPNYGFESTKAKVLNRDNYTCQCCKTKKGTLHVHHIIYRSNGGSDKMENLITLCENCHKKLHDGKLKNFEAKLSGKKKGMLKHATQMNSIRIQLLKEYPEAIETFGYITKANRQLLNISKDHYIDACVIASGGNIFTNNEKTFYKKVVGKENRSLSIFRKIPISITKSKIYGFNRYDKVNYDGNNYFIYGRSNTGPFIIVDIFGNKPQIGNKKTLGSINPKYLIKINSRKSVICDKKR